MTTSKVPNPVRTVGYIGLGNADFSIASNLPKNGFNVIVLDNVTDKVQEAVKQWEKYNSFRRQR